VTISDGVKGARIKTDARHGHKLTQTRNLRKPLEGGLDSRKYFL
jgi:hypothetical protein